MEENPMDWPNRRFAPPLRASDDACGEPQAPPWVPQFLAGLIVNGSVKQALSEARTEFETAWALRSAEPAFAMYWDRALRVHKAVAAGLSLLDAIAGEEGAL